MDRLKPCPFCNGAVSITYNSFDKVFAIWHKNDNCNFIEPLYIDVSRAKSLKEACEIWNTRKDAAIVDPSFITDLEAVKDWSICGFRVEDLIKFALILREKKIEDVDIRDYNQTYIAGYQKAYEDINKQLEEDVKHIINGAQQ